jgi:proteasome assembly chaperone (PAC2) family protein
MASVEWFRHPELRSPVSILAFSGWGDAGNCSTSAAAHLIASIEGDAFASIDPDEFYNFTDTRPQVEFVDSGMRMVHWPRNEFHTLHLPDRDLVVMLGEEPNMRWRAFGEAVAEVLGATGVERVILLGAFLGQVPHSQPTPLVGSSPNPDLLARHEISSTNYEGPTGIVGVLTQQLGESGFDTMSIWAAVPHYLGGADYPPATYALVRKAGEVLGIDVAASELAAASIEFRLSVDAALARNEELTQYVRKLEADMEQETRSTTDGLVDEIERFLKDH